MELKLNIVTFSSHGFYLVTTAAEKPFALGKWVMSPQDDQRPRRRYKFRSDNDVYK